MSPLARDYDSSASIKSAKINDRLSSTHIPLPLSLAHHNTRAYTYTYTQAKNSLTHASTIIPAKSIPSSLATHLQPYTYNTHTHTRIRTYVHAHRRLRENGSYFPGITVAHAHAGKRIVRVHTVAKEFINYSPPPLPHLSSYTVSLGVSAYAPIVAATRGFMDPGSNRQRERESCLSSSWPKVYCDVGGGGGGLSVGLFFSLSRILFATRVRGDNCARGMHAGLACVMLHGMCSMGKQEAFLYIRFR